MNRKSNFTLISNKNGIITYKCDKCCSLIKIRENETFIKCFKCLHQGTITQNDLKIASNSMISESDYKFAEFAMNKSEYNSFVRYIPKKTHPFKNISKRNKKHV